MNSTKEWEQLEEYIKSEKNKISLMTTSNNEREEARFCLQNHTALYSLSVSHIQKILDAMLEFRHSKPAETPSTKEAKSAEEILRSNLHEGDMGSKLFAYTIHQMHEFADQQSSLIKERYEELKDVVREARRRENNMYEYGCAQPDQESYHEQRKLVDELIKQQ